MRCRFNRLPRISIHFRPHPDEAKSETVDVQYALDQSKADYTSTLADMEGAQVNN